ncbi:MAG TPA: hypothetical protein VM689_13405 [Aliidongia sp.]|nr:hypothetical protein [Aliidongia sp.]
MSIGHSRARTAQAAIVQCRFVKPGTQSGTAIQAAAATDSLTGVSQLFNNPQAGQRVDVIVAGPAKLELGATVKDGDLLTADAEGRGVGIGAAPAAGTRVGAQALFPGNVGDVIDVIVVNSLA